jgi:CheY-like chemotaxis protein
MIVTDHSMPGGRGDTFLAALRQSEQETGAGSLPVIVLTADTSEATRRKLLASGASLVLAKPAEPAVLMGAVTRLCRMGSVAA